jgi:enterobactin synthetase component D
MNIYDIKTNMPFLPHVFEKGIKISYDEKCYLQLKNLLDIPSSIENASLKRKIEFAAGRYCGIKALEKAGLNSLTSIPFDKNRIPLWPEGFLGSITHSHGKALAQVSMDKWIKGLGIDLEKKMSDGQAKKLIKVILTKGELRRFATLITINLAQTTTLIFSAKESIFKCLFPTLRVWLNFNDIELCHINSNEQTFTIKILKNNLGLFDGQYSIDDDYIFTRVIWH